MQNICVEFYIKYDLSHLFITLKQFIQKVYIYIIYIYSLHLYILYYIYILYYFQCRNLSKQIEIFYVESSHCFLSRFYLRDVSNLVISTRAPLNRNSRRDFSTLRTVYCVFIALISNDFCEHSKQTLRHILFFCKD